MRLSLIPKISLIISMFSGTSYAFTSTFCNGADLKTVLNPYTGKQDYVCASQIPSGGTSGQCLTTDGGNPPIFSWSDCVTTPPVINYALLEDGSFLLLEDGTKMEL